MRKTFILIKQIKSAHTHTFSMRYHTGARPRGLGGVQLRTMYVLFISVACTLVGGPGIVTYTKQE